MIDLSLNPSREVSLLNLPPRKAAHPSPLRKMALLATFLACCSPANAKVLYVNGAKASSGNGTTWGSSYKYLRDALAASGTNDEIWMAAGPYYPDETTGLDQEVIFGDREVSFEINGQKIYGGFAGGETSLTEQDPVANPTILTGDIWAGQKIYATVHVAMVNADSTLDGLTIENGNANGAISWTRPRIPVYDRGGGCFVAKDKVLNLQDCTFSGNGALELGGAIMLENGNTSATGRVVATNCTFDQNTVEVYSLGPGVCEGGAIYGNVTATNCTFTSNGVTGRTVANGGAIAGDVTATNCTFAGNSVVSTGANSTNPNSSGGAILGDVTGINCTFTANSSTALLAYGGAIRGAIEAANFVFSDNFSTTGTVGTGGLGNGGGGALYTEAGTSSLVNCVFTFNTSGVRGGAIVGGPNPDSSSLLIADCTFLDNGVETGFRGAALSCMGIVRIANNIFWNTANTLGSFDQTEMINVTDNGLLRNTYQNYPVPPDFARNVVKLGSLAVTNFTGADVYIGDPNDTLVTADPLFGNSADPDGADNLWRTADDGLRLQAGSSAIGTTSTIMNRGQIVPYRNFLTKDTFDIDGDGNVSERTPADIAGYARVQNSLLPLPSVLTAFLDMGAYEYGDLLNDPDISVEYPSGTILVDGTSSIDFSALSSIPTTLVIKNLGGSDLSNLSITGDGADIKSFAFTQPEKTVLGTDEMTSFTVTFAPKLVGNRNAVIHIISNDGDENPFDLNLTGDAQLPDIAVEQPVGTPLVDAVSTVNYGNVRLDDSATKTFTITNTGLGNLLIDSVSITGAGASSYVASAPALTFLTTGQSTTIDLTFSPKAVGNQNAALIINSTDPDAEASFSISLTANGIGSPEISVRQPFSPEVEDGEINGFGLVVKNLTYTKTFVIKNIGTATLNNLSVSISGSKDFNFEPLKVDKLKPGKSTNLKVTFRPTSTARSTAMLQILSNDADEGVINLKFTGKGKSSSKSKSKRLRKLASSASPLSAAPVSAEPASGLQGVLTKMKGDDGLTCQVLTVEKSADWDLTTHQVEVSPDLVNWFSGSRHTTVLLDNSTLLKVRDNTPIAQGKKRYIRFK
jgi:hypothetical protein